MNNINYTNIPAIAQLNKVKGFDPLKFLRKKISLHTKKPVMDLDLKYKKLWFRLVHKDGRIIVTPLKITDNIAVFEATIYFHKNDENPVASYTAEYYSDGTAGRMYIQQAQYEAANQALTDAGFGIQFCDVGSGPDSEIYDTKISLPQSDEKENSELYKVPVKLEKPVAEAEFPKSDCEATPAKSPETKNQDETVIPTVKGIVSHKDSLPATDSEKIPSESPDEEPNDPETAQAYTMDMPVEEIYKLMTLEDARQYFVTVGTCSGFTLEQVAQRRPASLKWYLHGYSGEDNILRAGAKLLLDEMQLEKAG